MEYHQLGLRIAKKVGNKDLEGKTYLSLGTVHWSLSDFKKAIENYQEGLNIVKQVGDKATEGTAYVNLGMAYHHLGDFETAIKNHEEALRLTKEVGNKYSEGKAYLSLGNAYFSLGEFEDAINNCQDALSIANQVEDRNLEARAYSDLGLAYYALGDNEKAIEFHHKNLNIARKLGIKDLEGAAYLNLGRAYVSLSDLKTAKEFYRQALGIAKEIGNKLAQAKACANLGYVYCALNDVSVGEDFYKSSVRLFDETRALLKSNDEWKIGLRHQHEGIYRKLWHVQLQQNKTKEALSTAEKGRAQALMDLMESEYGVKSAQPQSADEHISCVSEYLTSMTIFLAEASHAVNFWVLQNGQQCKFVKKTISDGLESLTHDTYKHIGVFKKVMCENRSLDEPADEESEEVSERGNLDEKEFASEEKTERGDPLKALSDALIGPISHLIEGDELIIVPDAAMFLVPYAALVDQHSKYLSETLRIRLVPTLTSLKLMAECPEVYYRTSGALLVGDPLLENVPLKLKQLPAAKKEVEMIGTILNITPLTGENATKAEVLNKLNSVALVHIAAHGQAKTGEIVLCPNPDGPKKEDYLLTMSDVLNIKLRAKLVVLSCCYSGRGKIKEAEGVVGLARAFLGAGARSVLASLWAISDEATSNFIRYFYEHLMRGESAGKALDHAMKRMRDYENFREVRYWAPFVLIGDDVTLNLGKLSNVSDV